MSQTLTRMTNALRPLSLYNLKTGSLVLGELTCYAGFLDEVETVIDDLLTEGFVQTATERGIARMEALTNSRQREDTPLEKRREMLLYRFSRRPDDFTLSGMENGLRAIGLAADLVENLPQEQLILSDETTIADLQQYLRIRREAKELLPAHLEINFAMGTFTWTVFEGKDFTWSQWDGLDMNWMAYEIYH